MKSNGSEGLVVTDMVKRVGGVESDSTHQGNFSNSLKPIWTGNLVLEMYDCSGRIVYGVERSQISSIHRRDLIGAVIETTGVKIGPDLRQTIQLTSQNIQVVQYGVLLNLVDKLKLLEEQLVREQKEERRQPKRQLQQPNAPGLGNASDVAKRRLNVDINRNAACSSVMAPDTVSVNTPRARDDGERPRVLAERNFLRPISFQSRAPFYYATRTTTQAYETIRVDNDMAFEAFMRAQADMAHRAHDMARTAHTMAQDTRKRVNTHISQLHHAHKRQRYNSGYWR